MNDAKRNQKENNIIDAAEQLFKEVGFKNAKMEDLASAAGITKVTLYSYFQSKENLYMAVTYRALQLLNDNYYKTLDANRNNSGLDSVLALENTFMEFCENNFLYSEALLEYFSLVRSTAADGGKSRMTEALRESLYYMKLQDIHNLPFKLTAKEIERGIKDGSIQKNVDPMFFTLQGWIMIVGYVKVMAASGASSMPLFNVNFQDLKQSILSIARHALVNNQSGK